MKITRDVRYERIVDGKSNMPQVAHSHPRENWVRPRYRQNFSPSIPGRPP